MKKEETVKFKNYINGGEIMPARNKEGPNTRSPRPSKKKGGRGKGNC